MKTVIAALAMATGLAVTTGLATPAAAACNAGKAGSELTAEEALSVYDCLKDGMYEGYNKGGKRWIPSDYVKDYLGWKPAGTAPAAPGFHGSRYLFTYVNETGWDAYTDYRTENVAIPAGTVIAKVSFNVGDDGEARPGPLFLMEKAEAGASPQSGDWYYMMVGTNGSPQAINVMSACVECHQGNFGEQGGLGYPVEDVRLSK